MTEKKMKTAELLLPVLACLAAIFILSLMWQQQYERAAFSHLSAYTEAFLEQYPEERGEVLGVLKEYQSSGDKAVWQNDFLEQFGYREDDFLRGENRAGYGAALAAAALSAVISLSFWKKDRRCQIRIRELTGYLERVNTQAAGILIQGREDDFSRLQDEIYKTVTNLYAVKEEAVKARERFAEHLADIAHQLKTPITGALLSLELLEKETQNGRCLSVRRKLEGLGRLEEALLTLSRIDSGALQLEKETVDVYTALELAAGNLEEQMAQRGVFVEIPEKEGVEILGDLEWTMEALMNLMKNCMEHSREGGKIYCDYFCDLLGTKIRIWDQGEGFAPEDLPRLFDRFYRGKNGTEKGCGIGLSLARRIVEMENGSLTAGNLREGGACFEIRIPNP